jgi:hypothetical protein
MLEFPEIIIGQSPAGYGSVAKNKRKEEKGKAKKQKLSFFTDADYK